MPGSRARPPTTTWIPTRVAVVIGTGIGGVTSLLGAVRPHARQGPARRLATADPDEHAQRAGGLRGAGVRRAGRRAHDGQRVRVRIGGRRLRPRPDRPRTAPTWSSSAAPRRAYIRSTSPASRRCERCRPVTTSRSARRGRGTRDATASCSARAPACWFSSGPRRRLPAAARRTPCWPAPASPPTPTTSCSRTRPARSGRCAWLSNAAGIDPDDIVHVNAHAHIDAGRRHGRGERGSPTCSARTPSSPAPSR